jgi:hypothetical protein
VISYSRRKHDEIRKSLQTNFESKIRELKAELLVEVDDLEAEIQELVRFQITLEKVLSS